MGRRIKRDEAFSGGPATSPAVTIVVDAPLRPPPARHLVVVGMGLVGGSLCRALRAAYPALRLSGVDRQGIIELALEQQIVDDGVAADDDGAVHALLAEADAVVLSLPVLAVIATMERHRDVLTGTLVTDTGSTKAAVVDAARVLGLRCFVGGHPMAGKSSGGLAWADARLFDGARWFLCADTEVEPLALARARALVTAVGADPVEVDAADHDRDVALTSHLPHLLANVLAEAVLAASATDAAGGSLRDILKVAGAPIEVWGDTISTNRVAIGTALDDVIARLTTLRRDLDSPQLDTERLKELFAHGRALRERLHG
jgi:prephenate dehydrogenase